MAVLYIFEKATGLKHAIGGTSDADAIHDNVSGEIAPVTEKVTPVNADLVLIEDSEASNAKKRVQIGNLSSVVGAQPGEFHIPMMDVGTVVSF